MPSRPRDPQDLFEFFDIDDSPSRVFAPGRYKPSPKSLAPPRLEPISQTQAFAKRSTTLRLPALDQDGFRKRSTTLRLPALDPATFHTRTTLPRISAAQEEPSEEQPLQPEDPPEPSPADDLWLIAGPGRPGAQRPMGQPGPLTPRMRMHLVLLVLALLVLLGAQGFVSHLAGECVARGQPSCLALGLATDSQASSAPSTTSGAALPAIPDDLPDNVRSFITLALPYAVQAHQALGWPTSVLLAQWGLEHGWSVPDAQGYNWGNTEYAPGCPYAGSRFCYADTPAEGLREYIYTAQLNYYDGVRAAVAQGADATALALGESPWDAGHYGGADQPGSSLLAIMHNFNFYRFDVGG